MGLKRLDWLPWAKKGNKPSHGAALLQLKFNSSEHFILQNLNIRFNDRSYSTCSSNSNGKTNIIFNHLPKSDFFFNLLDEFIPENNSIPMLQTQHLKSKLNKRSTSIFPHNYRQKFYFFLNSIKGQKFFIIKEVKENKKKGMKRNNGPIQTRHGRPSFCIRGWFWIHQRKQQ